MHTEGAMQKYSNTKKFVKLTNDVNVEAQWTVDCPCPSMLPRGSAFY